MPNVNKVIKEEIVRVCRLQIREATGKMRRDTVALKTTVADLKRRLAIAERALRSAAPAPVKASRDVPQVAADDVARARPTAEMIKSVRARFGVSQKDFAKLLGVSGQAVYLWESKTGRIELRNKTKARLMAVRKLGKREVAKLLE